MTQIFHVLRLRNQLINVNGNLKFLSMYKAYLVKSKYVLVGKILQFINQMSVFLSILTFEEFHFFFHLCSHPINNIYINVNWTPYLVGKTLYSSGKKTTNLWNGQIPLK